MLINSYELNVTTNAAGAVTALTPHLTGEVVAIVYKKPSSGGLSTATFAINAKNSEIDLWGEAGVNASKTVVPTQPIHDQNGDARVFETGGENLAGPIYLANEQVEVAVTNGGNETSGKFLIYVKGPTG